MQSTQESVAELQQSHDEGASVHPESRQRRAAIDVPDAPEEMQLQSSQEWTADQQAEVRSSNPTGTLESIEPQTSSQAPELQSKQETTADLQSRVNASRQPGQAPDAIDVPKTPKYRKLEPTAHRKVGPTAAGTLKKLQPTAFREANWGGTKRSVGREEQLYGVLDWKKTRGLANKSMARGQETLKVGDPDPAFPGQLVKGAHLDHVVPARTIRDMQGFAMLDDSAQAAVLNTPENLEYVSDAVNLARGDKSYEAWAGENQQGLSIDPVWLDVMVAKENTLRKLIADRIDALLRRQMAARHEWR